MPSVSASAATASSAAFLTIHLSPKDRADEEIIRVDKNYSGNGFNLKYGSKANPDGTWRFHKTTLSRSRLMSHLENVFALAALDGANPSERYFDIQVFFPMAPSVIVLARDTDAHRRILDCIDDALDTWPNQKQNTTTVSAPVPASTTVSAYTPCTAPSSTTFHKSKVSNLRGNEKVSRWDIPSPRIECTYDYNFAGPAPATIRYKTRDGHF